MLTEDEAPQALACLKPREACGLWAECEQGKRGGHGQGPGTTVKGAEKEWSGRCPWPEAEEGVTCRTGEVGAELMLT